MRFGKPVIALNIGAAREVIHNEENGLLVHSEESTLLAAAISDLIGDRARRRAMGLRAREIYEQRFTVPLMADGVVTAFRRAMKGWGRDLICIEGAAAPDASRARAAVIHPSSVRRSGAAEAQEMGVAPKTWEASTQK